MGDVTMQVGAPSMNKDVLYNIYSQYQCSSRSLVAVSSGSHTEQYRDINWLCLRKSHMVLVQLQSIFPVGFSRGLRCLSFRRVYSTIIGPDDKGCGP